jgi:2-keto-4-pentenoate hydratase
MNLWEDARVARGMRIQLEMRRKRLDSGDAPLGWKVGFAAPEMLKRLGITGPLVGFLTRKALVHSGANVSLAGAAPAKAGSASDGIVCRVLRRGREFARTSDPQANTGKWVDIVRHVADVLDAFGERLRGGEIIITGSVVPPIAIEPGKDTIAFEVDPVGAVEVRFSDFKQPGK